MRGRKPTPPHLRALSGGADDRPAGTASGESPSHGVQAEIPAPPDHLDAEARAEWDRLAPELLRAGLIALIFRGVLTGYCVAWSRHVAAERELLKTGLIVMSPNKFPIQSPYLPVSNRALEMMRAFACEMGMTPVSLARAMRSDQLDWFDD